MNLRLAGLALRQRGLPQESASPKERLHRCLDRFAHEKYMLLSDRDYVLSIFRDWSKYWDIPLVDPNE